jgi:hypothetical protein
VSRSLLHLTPATPGNFTFDRVLELQGECRVLELQGGTKSTNIQDSTTMLGRAATIVAFATSCAAFAPASTPALSGMNVCPRFFPPWLEARILVQDPEFSDRVP